MSNVKTIILGIVFASLSIPAVSSTQAQPITLAFQQPAQEGSDTVRTLQSLVKVQGTGGLNQDGLYLITQVGDRSALFAAENQKSIDNPWRVQTWRYCSQFATHVDGASLMGRNWDNQNVGSIIVCLNQPPNAYASVSFCRAMDLSFPLNILLEQITDTDLGNRLMLAPFYATDGINERGLAITVAGVAETNHPAPADSNLILVTYLIRMMLDRAANVDEAVALAQRYVPFDLDRYSLNSHLLVADSAGHSAVLEYTDHWEITDGTGDWQVMTNKPIASATDAELRERCWRYASISSALDKSNGRVDWDAGLGILRDAAQRGTTWSVVYSPSGKELHFCVYQKWGTVYWLRPF